MQMLKSRLYEIELQKRNELRDAANANKRKLNGAVKSDRMFFIPIK
jgi:peptide chain release factor 2